MTNNVNDTIGLAAGAAILKICFELDTFAVLFNMSFFKLEYEISLFLHSKFYYLIKSRWNIVCHLAQDLVIRGIYVTVGWMNGTTSMHKSICRNEREI